MELASFKQTSSAVIWKFLTTIFTGTTGRDRCDSLPSRARTTSEGQPTMSNYSKGANSTPRPHSIYERGFSPSPPITSMPISPASDVCTSDSAGSSPSMDECGENILEEGTVSKYRHPLTPDEPVISEKKSDDYITCSIPHWNAKNSPNFKSHSPSHVSIFVIACSRALILH